jgi:hypothetical protein
MTALDLSAYFGVLVLFLVITPMFFRYRTRRKPGYGISLLVPFRTDNGRREETWNWLQAYWRHELPGAEVVIGTDNHPSFCKTAAVNRAAQKARGDVLVILDADCYVSGDVIEHCAAEIRQAVKRGRRLWFMPYRYFYRLTDTASREIISSNPANPQRYFASSPPRHKLQETKSIDQGHWFGALIQIMPREAFDLVGGMDTRFNGWCGEDVAFMHAVDTLYVPHKTVANGVIHLWHPSIGASVRDRMWTGQAKPGGNGNLAAKYHRAMGDPVCMRELVDVHETVERPEPRRDDTGDLSA